MELELELLGEVDKEPDLIFPEDACLSWVALVPLGIWRGEVEAGDEEVLGLEAGIESDITLLNLDNISYLLKV